MFDLVSELVKYKKRKNCTYKELADQLGTTHSICYDLMKGRRRFVDLKLLQRISKLLQEG